MRQKVVVIVVLVAGWWSVLCGQGIEDIVFYDTFESGDTTGWWAPARVGKTGQTTCYDADATPIACSGTGQDGDLKPGVAWPNPRFVDNADGTVTDMLTGLVWLKDASCIYYEGSNENIWTMALMAVAVLADGQCGLTDGSVGGNWRVPSINELKSLIDYKYVWPALSNGTGTAQWSDGDVFVGVEPESYWSSTSSEFEPMDAWLVSLGSGNVNYNNKMNTYHVWPVRSGQ